MCSEIGIIDHGRLVAQGSVNEIMKRMTKKRIVYIRPFANMEGLLTYLKEQPLVSDLADNSQDAEFAFDGSDEELARLLTGIVKNNIPVLSFKEKEGNLEEIFMQMTGGERNDA